MSRFSVPEVSCDHCNAKIETALFEADGGADLSFDMEAREVSVDSALGTADVVEAIKSVGYESGQIG